MIAAVDNLLIPNSHFSASLVFARVAGRVSDKV